MVVVPKTHRGKFVLFLLPRPDISLTLSLSLPLPPLVAYFALFCLAFLACQAMVAADQWFMKEAEASTRAGSSWEFAAVRNSLQVHTYLRAQCLLCYCCTASPVQSCASFPSEREITDASVIFFCLAVCGVLVVVSCVVMMRGDGGEQGGSDVRIV